MPLEKCLTSCYANKEGPKVKVKFIQLMVQKKDIYRFLTYVPDVVMLTKLRQHLCILIHSSSCKPPLSWRYISGIETKGKEETRVHKKDEDKFPLCLHTLCSLIHVLQGGPTRVQSFFNELNVNCAQDNNKPKIYTQ